MIISLFILFFLVLCFCSARIHYTFGSQSLRNHIICLFACVAMFILHDAPWWCRWWFIVLAALWFFITYRSCLRVSNSKKNFSNEMKRNLYDHIEWASCGHICRVFMFQYIYAWSFIWLIRAMRWFIEVVVNSMAFSSHSDFVVVGHLVQFFLPFVSHLVVWFFFASSFAWIHIYKTERLVLWIIIMYFIGQ